MKKDNLLKLKKDLLVLSFAGVILSGCAFKDENGVPIVHKIPAKYYDIDKFYENKIINNQEVKYYNSENVCFLLNKENNEIKKVIYHGEKILFGIGYRTEIYDLESEQMLVYKDGIDVKANEEYYNYLNKKYDKIFLDKINQYIPDIYAKSSYSLEEINELEDQLKQIMKTKDISTQKKLSFFR